MFAFIVTVNLWSHSFIPYILGVSFCFVLDTEAKYKLPEEEEGCKET